MDECRWCGRICPRCGYKISGGWEHVEMVQPAGSNVSICRLERLQPRPLGFVIAEYFDHEQHSSVGGEHWGAFLDDVDGGYEVIVTRN